MAGSPVGLRAQEAGVEEVPAIAGQRLIIQETGPPGAVAPMEINTPAADSACLPPAPPVAGCGACSGMLAIEAAAPGVVPSAAVVESPVAGEVRVPYGATGVTVNECAGCKDAVDQLNARIDQAVQDLMELHRQKMPYEEHAEAMREQLAKLNDLSAQRTKMLRQVQNQLRNHGKKLDRANEQLTELRKEVGANTETLAGISENIEAGGQALRHQDERLQKLTEQLGGLREQLETVQQQVAEVTDWVREAKARQQRRAERRRQQQDN